MSYQDDFNKLLSILKELEQESTPINELSDKLEEAFNLTDKLNNDLKKIELKIDHIISLRNSELLDTPKE